MERKVSAMECLTAVSNSRNMTSRRKVMNSATVRGLVGWVKLSICFCISLSSAPEILPETLETIMVNGFNLSSLNF